MSENILDTRHSARSFLDQPVSEELIRQIIAEAQNAPSWCNSQPAKVYVLTGDAAKKMAETHVANNVNKTRSWAEIMPPQPDTWNPNNNDNIAEYLTAADTNEGQNDRFGFIARNKYIFHSPVIVYITIPRNSTMYQAYDAGAFGYGICLAAHAHGLGSIPAYEFVRFPQEIRDALEIPESESLLMGIGIGYADEAEINNFHAYNGRVPVESILTIKK